MGLDVRELQVEDHQAYGENREGQGAGLWTVFGLANVAPPKRGKRQGSG